MNTRASMEKMNACMKPTKSSRRRKGMGPKNGRRDAMIIRSTSPAKTFPNSLKENEIILANSEISSRRPIKKPIALLKLRNFFK